MILKIIGIIFLCLGILAGAVVLYLLIVAIMPGFPVPRQTLEKTEQSVRESDLKASGARKDVTFEVKGSKISAWLYLPDDLSSPVPCIIMGHGAGGTKDMGLDLYAVRYVNAGFAVLVFDYRHFGESQGEPRNLIWIPYQLTDWSAAINYVRTLKEIDQARIALWGTSMSGGHVIVTASKEKDIACVVAQCPGLDGEASGKAFLKREGLGYLLRMMVHGQRDIVRSWLGLSPHKIPLVGKHGDIALMPTQEAYDALGKLKTDSYVNEVCARIIIRADKYRPVKHAQNIRCPVLLQICDNDFFTPLSAAKETEKNLGKYAEVKHYPIGHFDIYFDDDFEKAVRDQLEFFKKHL